MSLAVKIPNLGESITTGLLVKWHVADGDIVQKDQALYELETDKITAEGTAEASGKIALKVAEGTEVKIGETVAEIDESAASASATKTSAVDGAPTSAPAAQALANDEPTKNGSATPARQINDSKSPAVRRLAAETGIDPASVTGTGKAGRVTKADMVAAASAPKPSKSDEGPTSTLPNKRDSKTSSGEKQSRKKLSPLRARIAERLVQAQHEAAMLTTFNEVDMSAVMALRQKYQDGFVKKHGIKLGFMSFFAKAVVHALKEVPAINAQIEGGDTLVENHYYDLGVAVSTPKGLMVPVIRDCDTLGMADIERQIADAATKARDGKITLADLEGGVFTITNGGIFGSMLSTPILNAPQSAILGLHAINERPVAIDGQVVIRPMMYLALSYDHRVVDGREAVTFLVKVKQAIEDPARLLIGA